MSAETEAPDGPPEPRAALRLQGHESQEQAFLDAWSGGRFHHAWLLTGPEGVGKATFAFRAIRRVLGAAPDPAYGTLGADPDDPVVRRIAAQGHADLVTIERSVDPKRGVMRSEITVDEARAMTSFFEATSSEGGWRACLVDPADALNVNAANALLKTLEEPPSRSVIFLVAHAPGRLPATVRSRCRTLAFEAPGQEIAAQLVSDQAGLEPRRAEAIADLSDGRPGAALRMALVDADRMAGDIDVLLKGTGPVDRVRAHALAEALVGKNAREARVWFLHLLARAVRHRARAEALQEPPRSQAGLQALEAWMGVWEKLGQAVRDLDRVNLDPKLVALDALTQAGEAARVAARVG